MTLVDDIYFKVEYTVHGKSFTCFVKADDDSRIWTCVYINPRNPKNDCFVRREVGSPMLYKHRIKIDESAFVKALDTVYKTARSVLS